MIGAEMITTLKSLGANIKSMVITSALEDDHQKDIFNRVVSIDDTNDGFAKLLDKAVAAAESKSKLIRETIDRIMPSDEEGLLLVTTGSGATGLGGALKVLEILYKDYRKAPPVITLLPEIFENSRVQYNMSYFLYKIAFEPGNYGNTILLLDNKPNFREMDKSFAEVSQRRIKSIPQAFADLLYASFEDALSPEFDGNVKDLYEVMHTPGISVFIAEDLSTEDSDAVDSSRISDVLSESVISMTSLSKDQVFDSKNAFISLFNIDTTEKLSFQTEFEARKLYKSFRETHPFIKFVKPDKKMQGTKPKLRAIISGIPLPNRALQIMRIARDTRKRIIYRERDIAKEVLPLDIEEVTRLEDKLYSD